MQAAAGAPKRQVPEPLHDNAKKAQPLKALAVLLHWPNNFGFALEHLLHEGGVADGDGIPEEENVGGFFFLGVKEGTAEERAE